MKGGGAKGPGFGLRAQLFLASLALIAVGLLGSHAYVSRALTRDLETQVREELDARAELARDALRAAGAFDARAAGALVRRLAASARARVTLVDPTGRVVADSSVESDRLPALENHLGRPEVREAMARGQGFARRESGTLRQTLTYAARRLEGPGGSWVVRVALSSQTVSTALATLRRFLVAGTLLGLVAAAGLSSLAVQLIARPVRQLTATARVMVGDLAVRARFRRGGEVGELAAALDELADGLAASLAQRAQERDRLGAILEAMTEGVLVTRADGTITLANRALREMFLVGRDVRGQAPTEVVRSAELRDAIGDVTRGAAAREVELSIEGVRPRRVRVAVAPLGSPDAGVVAVFSDVTDLRRLETLRKDFVANVSHELRTPIAAIRAAAETLQAGALDTPEDARDFVAVIDRHAARLHRLVEDLLELSRIEAQQLALALAPVPVAPVVERALELLRPAAGRRRIELASVVDPDPGAALADLRALEQVLENLVDNAIKYAPEGSIVTVRARRRAGGVRLSVEDTGPGIEARHLPRIFERFYRVEARSSQSVRGTGLGLAIVKHLAEAMRATVSVESIPGRGSSFHVDLRGEA